MRAIDTNVLVRLITRDEPRQVAAAEAFVANGAWISCIVLVEAAWVLASVYNLNALEIARAVEMLLNRKDLAFQDGCGSFRFTVKFNFNIALGKSACAPKPHFNRDIERRAA